MFETKKEIRETVAIWGSKPEPFQLDILHRIENGLELTCDAMRQIGKSETISDSMMLGGIKGEKSLYTSYDDLSTAEIRDRTFEKAEAVMEDTPGVIKKIVVSGTSTPHIEFNNGGRIEFRIRGPKLGRGAKRDRLYFDEAAQLSHEMFAKVSAFISNSKTGRIIMMGTPPSEQDFEKYGTDTPFIKARLNGGPNYISFGIGEYDKNLKLSPAVARKYNPLWRKIPRFNDKQARFQSMMNHKSYCVEYLGAWAMPELQEIHDPHFSMDEVKNMLTDTSSRSSRFTASVGVYPDSDWAYVAYNDGIKAEVVGRFDVTGGDLSELVEWLTARFRKLETIRIPNNQRGQTIERMLKKNRVFNVELMKVTDTAMNISRFEKQTAAGSLKIYKSGDVEMALSSFWLGLIASSGSYEIFSGLEKDKAIVLALVNSTKDGKITARAGAAMKLWTV
jgi:hypothetical protein